MLNGKTIWLAVNAASGSNSEEALAALDQAFAQAGGAIARRVDFHQDGAPTIEDLRGAGVDLLVIFTGDGTMNSIVRGLHGWEGAVLVLPGGTMNVLARRLHGEADPAAIIARVAAGEGRRVRPILARSRHGDGLSGILAGPGTAWAEVREAMREIDVLGTIRGTAGAIGASTAGARVFCREPGCGREDGYAAIQLVPQAGGLAVHAYYAETLADYALTGMALLRRNFREGPHDELGLYDSVRLGCLEGEEMGLLIDGEQSDGAAREETFVAARCEVDMVATVDGE